MNGFPFSGMSGAWTTRGPGAAVHGNRDRKVNKRIKSTSNPGNAAFGLQDFQLLNHK
jgi:hypothetical protein